MSQERGAGELSQHIEAHTALTEELNLLPAPILDGL